MLASGPGWGELIRRHRPCIVVFMSRGHQADDGHIPTAHPIADIDIIERARRGDRDAIGALWRVYHPQLLRLLRAKRCAAPDDVASQVWIDVGRSLDSFEGDGRDFRRWLFTIANRRHIDEGRRQTRRRFRERPTEQHDPVADVAATDPTDEIGSLERALQLVRMLPPNMAEAVMLRVVHDLTVGEAAAIMNTTEGNVRVLVHRGITRLRVAMGPATEREEFRVIRNVDHVTIVDQS